MRRLLANWLNAKRGGRTSARPGSGAFASPPAARSFCIWRKLPFVTFLAAVIVADVAVAVVGFRMSSFYRSVHERGQTVLAEVTRRETRPAIRGADKEFYFYTYRTAAGAVHQNSTAMHSLAVGDTFPVVYLPDASEHHVLFPMTPSRIRQPIRATCAFAASSLGVTVIFGALVQWTMRRRERRLVD
jgi:hypothetical protein